MRGDAPITRNKRSPLTMGIALVVLVAVVAVGIFLLGGGAAGLSLSSLSTPTVGAGNALAQSDPQAVGDGPVSIVWTTSPTLTALGQTVSMTVQAQAGAQQISGAEIYVNYPTALLNASDLVPNTTALNTELLNNIDDTVGHIDYAYGRFSGTLPSGTFTLFSITFTAQACGVATLDFVFETGRTTDVAISGDSVLNDAFDGQITITDPSCVDETPSPTPTSTNTNTPVPPTNTFTPTSTNTPVPPTNTFTPTSTNTNTPVPPTNTFTPTSTNTEIPLNTNTPSPTHTATNTNTPVPPSETPTPSQTFTPAPPTDTPTITHTPTETLTPTIGPSPTPSNTPDPNAIPPTPEVPTNTPVPAAYVACDNLPDRTGGTITSAGGNQIAIVGRDSSISLRASTTGVRSKRAAQDELGNAYCRIIVLRNQTVTDLGEVGDPGLISMGVTNAVDIFGLLDDGTPANTFVRVMQICFAVEYGDMLWFASSSGAPRSYVPMDTYLSGEYVCTFIGHDGTIVQTKSS